MIKKASKAEIKKERSPAKIKKVLEEKGYKEGKLPKGKELHHVKPVLREAKQLQKILELFQ